MESNKRLDDGSLILQAAFLENGGVSAQFAGAPLERVLLVRQQLPEVAFPTGNVEVVTTVVIGRVNPKSSGE